MFLELILAQSKHSISSILNYITFKKYDKLYTYVWYTHKTYTHTPDIVRYY